MKKLALYMLVAVCAVVTMGAARRAYWFLPSAKALLTADLTYTSSTNPGALTLTHADAVATYMNSAGTMLTASANQARLHYVNISTAAGWGMQYKGLRAEGARTNLILKGSKFDESPWAGAATVDANKSYAPAAPDGTTTADRITSTNVTSRNITLTLGANQLNNQHASYPRTYTGSVWCRFGNTTGGQSVLLTLRDGKNTRSATATTAWADGRTWRRIPLSCTFNNATSTSTTILLIVQSTNAASSLRTVYFWGAQVEEGAYASSSVLTDAATVARVADTITMPKAGIWDKQQGTVYAEVSLFGASAGADARGVAKFSASDVPLYVESASLKAADGTTTISTPFTYAENTTFKVAVTWQGSAMTVYNVTTGTSTTGAYNGTFGDGTANLTIGDGLNGCIKNLQIYRRALSLGELQAL